MNAKRKIYVASSWRNPYQEVVVACLRGDGHEVYDFKNPREGDRGFSWAEIDPNWLKWTADEYIAALQHPIAKAGFATDFNAMKWADTFVLVLPCGRSAHLELGWAVGQGKQTLVLTRNGEEPELMASMCDHICSSLEQSRAILALSPTPLRLTMEGGALKLVREALESAKHYIRFEDTCAERVLPKLDEALAALSPRPTPAEGELRSASNNLPSGVPIAVNSPRPIQSLNAEEAEAMVEKFWGRPTEQQGEPAREALGRIVREVWIAWAKEQPSPKASWLVEWEGLSEPDKEVDRRIGERLAREGRAAQLQAVQGANQEREMFNWLLDHIAIDAIACQRPNGEEFYLTRAPDGYRESIRAALLTPPPQAEHKT